MPKILSFHWNSTNKNIEYVLFNNDLTSIIIPFEQLHISSLNDADKVIDSLYNKIQNIPYPNALKIRYKILFPSPVSQNYKKAYKPNPLSDHIKIYFESKFKNVNDIRQIKRRLKGDKLNKFKRALSGWQLWVRKNGAYQVHLWSYAIEITNGNFETTIKKLWKIRNNIISKISRVQTQQFQQWYKAL